MSATTEPLTFTLPLPPNRGNARGHWRVQHAEKVGFWALLDVIAMATRRGGHSTIAGQHFTIPPAPRVPFPSAVLAVTFHVSRLSDSDNIVSRFKWVGDWLVTRGYVVDDAPHVLVWAGFPKQVMVPRREVRVQVTLTPRPVPQDVAA